MNRAHVARSHRPQLVQSHHVQLRGVNAAVAKVVAAVLSNMWFFWLCVALDLVEMVALVVQTVGVLRAHGDLFGLAILWVAFLSQTVIQLLALPVLAVMSDLQQRAGDARAAADHKTLTAIHTLAAEIHVLTEGQGKELARQTEILEALRVANGRR